MLMNYVALANGIPTRMHFSDDYVIERDIAVPETGRSKRIKSLVFQVDELDGEPASRTFSVLSEKLRSQLTPFLRDKKYLKYDFIITQTGAGFLRDWIVQPILRRD